ncbi:MAG: hypothetical protein P8Y23_18275 [Candidatus Lokiarchaeota archaeon]
MGVDVAFYPMRRNLMLLLACPSQAIYLKDKAHSIVPPDNSTDLITRTANKKKKVV